METSPKTVQSMEDFVRALRFPQSSPREIALYGFATLAFFLILWLIAYLMERRHSQQTLPTTPESPDHRANFRVPLSAEIEVLPEGVLWSLPARLSDLSAGGATFKVESTLLPSGRLRIRFPDEPGLGELQVKIVRSESIRARRRHYLHCKFLDPTLAQVQRLSRRVMLRGRQILRPG